MPLVSVVIPVYNGEKYVAATIKSVLSQTFTDYEIIVVDDGSTDNTRAILASFGEKIICISQANKGCASARNAGIRNAHGTYIALLDADDMWLEKKLETQLKLFHENPQVRMVGCGVNLIDEEGLFLRTIPGNEALPRELLVKSMYVRSVVAGGPSGIMLARECFDKVGYFDEEMRATEDRDMWLRVARTFEVKFIKEPLFNYRIHRHNLHKNVSIMKSAQLKFLTKHAKRMGFLMRQKAVSYIFLDAAREYYAAGRGFAAMTHSLWSIVRWPFKVECSDDKYHLFLKSFLLIGKRKLSHRSE